jgi:hypothetical protein
LVTLGYDELVAPGMFSGVSLDVREMRSAAGGVVRGLVAEVRESQYRTERAFVDADELPELLRGITALLDVKANPTVFKDFEVRYRTRGELEVSAYSSGGKIRYAISAGRVVRASRLDLSAHEIEALRSSIEQAQSRLASPRSPASADRRSLLRISAATASGELIVSTLPAGSAR